MVATKKGVVMDHLYKSLRGFMMEDKMGTAKVGKNSTITVEAVTKVPKVYESKGEGNRVEPRWAGFFCKTVQGG
eukprot:13643584-Ditylum_brightwellii.AAC.1